MTPTTLPVRQRLTSFDSFGLMTVTRNGTGFVKTTGSKFDVQSYSRFKYGDPLVARTYGEQMARYLEERILTSAVLHSDPIVITSSAYKMLPTAADSVTRIACEILRAKDHAVQLGRIHRTNLSNGDYAQMSADERNDAMRRNGIYIDDSLFSNRHIVVIDDIKITGSHEASIRRMFAQKDIKSLTHAYIVRMDPAIVEQDPAVEDALNRSWVRDLDSLVELIRIDPVHYLFNARTVKMILGSPVHELEGFLSSLRDWHIRQLYAGTIGDGYNVMEPYSAGFWCLHQEALHRGIVSLNNGL